MRNGPLSVLSKESQRTAGDEARTMNISAARAVAETVRTTLGPRGMDKMLVDSSGNVVVTNDGVTLLEEMDITHPAANLVIEVSQTQEEEVGDGTTSAVILAGELLSVAEDLIEQGIHPSSIVAGYQEAVTTAKTALDELAIEIDPDDTETLEAIAATAMTGKGAERSKELLAELVVEAVTTAVREDGTVDRDAIDVRSFPGRSVEDSRFISGTLVDKKPPHPSMPTSFTDANVLVYEDDLELSELEIGAGATITDVEQADAFADRDREELESVVDRIVDSGADVVLVDGGIDDFAQQRFVDAGVLALRRVSDDHRRRVAGATGAARVGNLERLTSDDLGHAGRVEREMIRELTHKGNARAEQTTVFDDLPESEIGTILLRGGTEHVVDEIERAIEDSIGVVSAAIEDGSVLPGAGAPEAELALAVREAAGGIGGREQLAVEAFAEALEAGPRTLAENSGHDAIDALVELTASHDGGDRTAGLDPDTGSPFDALEAGVVEPLRVKRTALESAVDAASMILRIDDVVAAGELSTAGDDDGAGPGAGAGPMGM
ncbi:thermosome subunit alpha [Natronoglomus mannanivorans]